MTARPWGLAIDFGTTATAAVTVTGQHVSLLSLDGGGRMSSSVYATGNDGELLVGKQADNEAAYALDQYESTPKRRIHRPSVRLGDRQYAPVDLIAAIMAHVLSEALDQHNRTAPAWLVLTHPVAWSASQRQVLADAVHAAARQLGVSLPDPVFVEEPVAAAQWYSRGTHHAPPEVGQKFAVYDLGGGTFDVAVLERTEQGYSVINPGGIDPLGGYDFDHRLFTYLGTKYIAKEDPDLWRALQRPDPGDVDMGERRRQMRTNVQYLKEQLSTKPSRETRLRGVSQPVLVTREDFETLIVADVDRTIDEFLTTLDECGLSPRDLAVIYRVGGASRIPLVGQKLEALGAPVYSDDDPKLVVALGAAITPGVDSPVLAESAPIREEAVAEQAAVRVETVAEKAPERHEAVAESAPSGGEAQPVRTQKGRKTKSPSPGAEAVASAKLGRWGWASVVAGTAILAFAVGTCVLSWLALDLKIGLLLIFTIAPAVIGGLLIRMGSLLETRAGRRNILFGVIVVAVAVAAVTQRLLWESYFWKPSVSDAEFEAGVNIFETVLAGLALAGLLLLVIPQFRRIPSRGAVAGLVVAGLLVAVAEAASLVGAQAHYGQLEFLLIDAIPFSAAALLVICGVLAGRRRKRLSAAPPSTV